MKNILGTGEHRYRVLENWAKLPDGWQLTDAASVAVDSKDRIYVFNRGEHPIAPTTAITPCASARPTAR